MGSIKRRIFWIATTLIGLYSVLSQWRQPSAVPRETVQGKNNTVLFLAIEHPGCSNVHLATAQGLLESFPEVQIHFASFPTLGKRLSRVSSFAKLRQTHVQDAAFHPLTGRTYRQAMEGHAFATFDEDGKTGAITKRGMEGVETLSKNLQVFVDPWNETEHLALFHQLGGIIESVDPAIVVLDTLFAPAIEATRSKRRLHAFVTPNNLVDNFVSEQPWLGMFWNYPAMASGFPFPIPFRLIPQNVWMNFRLVGSLLRMPALSEKRRFLHANGIPNPINFYKLHGPNVPWITQSTPGAMIPVDFVPPNVTCTGPITISVAPLEEQDPELWKWINQRPTVLINLGSAFVYSRTHTREMIQAISQVVQELDIQVIWKYAPPPSLPDFDWKSLVAQLDMTGRVKVETWLAVDPTSLLESGHIAAFVTHGGANGFHESIAAGVPPVVLPMWADLYNYAQLAEQIGVGVWGCPDKTPDWTADCLQNAISRIVTHPAYHTRAKEISKAAVANGKGRDIAASIIGRLARTGRA